MSFLIKCFADKSLLSAVPKDSVIGSRYCQI